jgi:hypothetical protein
VSRFRALVVVAVVVITAAGCDSSKPGPVSSASAVALANGSPTATKAASPAPSASPSPSSRPVATASPTATPSPTPTPTPTPKPAPVAWKSYTSKLYHYKVTYPPSWIVTPGNARLTDQFDAFGYPYVYIWRDVVSAGRYASVSLTVNHDIATTKSHYHAKVVSNKSIRLAGGYSGKIVVYAGTDHGLKITIRRIFVAKGRVGYFLDLFGDSTDATADAGLFKKLYLSWRPA